MAKASKKSNTFTPKITLPLLPTKPVEGTASRKPATAFTTTFTIKEEKIEVGRGVAAALNPAAAFTIDETGIARIRPAKTKHGIRRNGGKFEYAQRAIQALYGARPPESLDRTRLTDKVNDWLKRNNRSWYANHGPISRRVVARALQKVAP